VGVSAGVPLGDELGVELGVAGVVEGWGVMSGGPASIDGAGVRGAGGTVPSAPVGPQAATATVRTENARTARMG
jgi:hypothetical protein